MQTIRLLLTSLVFVLALHLVGAGIVYGAIPEVINVQGKLTNTDNTNVPNATYDMVLKIYDGAGSAAATLFTENWNTATLWSSTMTSAPAVSGETLTYSSNTNEASIQVGQILWNTTKEEAVVVTTVNTTTNILGISPTRQAWATTDTITNKPYIKDGIFVIHLNTLNNNLSGVNFNSTNLFLGINVNSDGEMKPRTQLKAVPYAFNAKTVNGLTVGATTGTLNIGNGKTIQFADNFSTTGANTLTLNTTAATNVTLPTSGTLATVAGSETLTNKTIGSTGVTISGAATDIQAAAAEGLTIVGNATSNIQTTSGNITLEPNAAATGYVQIGSGTPSANPDLLVLDTKNTAGDPAGVNGAIYYNSNTNTLRCFQNSAWINCIGATPSISSLVAAAGTNTINNANFTQTWNWNTLTVENALVLSANGLTSGSVLNVASSTTAVGASGDLAKFELTGNSTNITGNALKVGVTGATAAGTALNVTNGGTGLTVRFNDDGTYTDTTPFVIDNNGNVGIGTTAPGTNNLAFGNASNVIGVTSANGTLTINSNGSGGLTLDSTLTGAINIGNNANAKIITVGNNTGATALNFTSGTGLQTFTSSATTTGAFSFIANNITSGSAFSLTDGAVYTGTGLFGITANAATSGTIANITANGLTTGVGLSISSTSTALTTGDLLNLTASGAPVVSWTGDLATIEATGNSANLNGNALKVGFTAAGAANGTALNVTSGQTGASALVARFNDDGTYTDTTPFVIDNNGNVGIGTATPIAKLHNTGSTVLGALAVADVAAGGSIGTAATTVDIYTVFNVNQTTPNRTLTLPNPTNTTAGRVAYLNNVGTVEFMIAGNHVATGTGRSFVWNGSAWSSVFSNPGSGSQIKTKAANQSVTNSITLTDDTDLSFVVGPNETWVYEYNLQVTNANNATPDWKSAIFTPAGFTCNVTLSGIEPAGAAFPQAMSTNCTTPTAVTNTAIVADANIPFQVQMYGTVTSGASGGTVNMRFAERVAGVGTSITVMAGSILRAYNVTGADLAEIYYTKDQSIENGDIVALEGSGISQVKKAIGNAQNAIGIISTKPGLVIGEADGSGKPVIVGLAGRVPVKVNTQNGFIKPGDYITTSTVPGVGAKAIASGNVIGQALTGYDGDGVGSIIVFIKNTYFDGIYTETQSSNEANLTVNEPGVLETFFNNFLQDVKDAIFNSLRVTGLAEFFGKTIFNDDVKVNGNIIQKNTVAGKAIIKKGAYEVKIVYDTPLPQLPIVNATLAMQSALSDEVLSTSIDSVFNDKPIFIISKETVNGFTIQLSKVATTDITFNWNIVLIENPQTFESTINSSSSLESLLSQTSSSSSIASSTSSVSSSVQISSSSSILLPIATNEASIVASSSASISSL